MGQLIADNFAGTTGVELAAYSGNWIHHPLLLGNLQLTDGTVRASSAVSAGYYFNVEPDSADYPVEADIVRPLSADMDSSIAICARMSSLLNTMYRASVIPGSSAVALYKFIAGVATQLGSSVAVTLPAAGQSKRLALDVSGSTLKVYWDGALVITQTDASIPVKGYAGLRSYSASAPVETSVFKLDNFRAGQASAASEIAAAGVATASGAAALRAQFALAGIGVSRAGGAADTTVAVPLAAAGFAVSGGQASRTATVTIGAAALAQTAAQAGVSAAVLLTGAGAAQAAGNATLAAQLDALAAGAAQASGSANPTGGAPGVLTAAGGAFAAGSAVLAIAVRLVAAGAAQASGSAAGGAAAPGQLSASGQAQAGSWGACSALVTLTAAGFAQAMSQGQFAAEIPIQATSQAVAGGSAQAVIAGAVRHYRLQPSHERATRLAVSDQRQTFVECEASHA